MTERMAGVARQHAENGTQSAVDDSTRLLPPMDPSGRFGAPSAPPWADWDETTVIPRVPPAQPEQPRAEMGKQDHPCLYGVVAGMFLAAAVFVAGIVVGGAWF